VVRQRAESSGEMLSNHFFVHLAQMLWGRKKKENLIFEDKTTREENWLLI